MYAPEFTHNGPDQLFRNRFCGLDGKRHSAVFRGNDSSDDPEGKDAFLFRVLSPAGTGVSFHGFDLTGSVEDNRHPASDRTVDAGDLLFHIIQTPFSMRTVTGSEPSRPANTSGFSVQETISPGV